MITFKEKSKWNKVTLEGAQDIDIVIVSTWHVVGIFCVFGPVGTCMTCIHWKHLFLSSYLTHKSKLLVYKYSHESG